MRWAGSLWRAGGEAERGWAAVVVWMARRSGRAGKKAGDGAFEESEVISCKR